MATVKNGDGEFLVSDWQLDTAAANPRNVNGRERVSRSKRLRHAVSPVVVQYDSFEFDLVCGRMFAQYRITPVNHSIGKRIDC